MILARNIIITLLWQYGLAPRARAHDRRSQPETQHEDEHDDHGADRLTAAHNVLEDAPDCAVWFSEWEVS